MVICSGKIDGRYPVAARIYLSWTAESFTVPPQPIPPPNANQTEQKSSLKIPGKIGRRFSATASSNHSMITQNNLSGEFWEYFARRNSPLAEGGESRWGKRAVPTAYRQEVCFN
ncbi:MAG: hypothetical protein LBJ67_07670 [Planctomycetaceae bacterium]|jgi:hypothetical protein|nr:hypothetical protein [Planctomycetaceae bacterium]